MKKLFTTLLLIATTMSTWAYDIRVDGIFYNLDSLNHTAEVTNINGSMFPDSVYVGDAVIPDTIKAADGTAYVVTAVANWAFSSCDEVPSIVLPNTIKKIGHDAFFYCYGLTSLFIPKSVESIGDECFSHCIGLDSLKVDPENTVYDSRNNCNAIIETKTNKLLEGSNNTVIPDDVTAIGDCSFTGRAGLTSLTIPASVTTIGDAAFADCAKLASAIIPKSVASIGEQIYAGCESLTSLSVEEGNTVYDSRDNCNAIIVTATDSLIASCLSTTEIPNTVKIIGDYAFNNCSITSMVIPESVTKICGSAFAGCEKMTTITIGNSVAEIGMSAFNACTSLDSVVIGSSVKNIGLMAFCMCPSLKTVVCYAEEVPAMQPDVFFYSSVSTATLKVPEASVDLYKAADQWKDFGTIEAIETTGITETHDSSLSTLHSTLYNLAGQKAKSTDRGVIITGGRKVIKQ